MRCTLTRARMPFFAPIRRSAPGPLRAIQPCAGALFAFALLVGPFGPNYKT